MPQRQYDPCSIPRRDPAFCYESFPPRIVVEQIQRLVNALLLCHCVLPALDAVSNLHQLSLSRCTRVVQHIPNVLQSGRHLPQRIGTLVAVGVDRVKRPAHGLGDLPDLREELLSMCEDDEYVLPGLRSSSRVDEDLVNVGVVHIQIATQDTPEDPLERRDTSSVDSSGDEPGRRQVRRCQWDRGAGSDGNVLEIEMNGSLTRMHLTLSVTSE